MLKDQLAKRKGVRFIITPGHGYLEVPDTSENRKCFSPYSYENNGKLYLEEDEDAGKWIDANGLTSYRQLPNVHAEDYPELGFLLV